MDTATPDAITCFIGARLGELEALAESAANGGRGVWSQIDPDRQPGRIEDDRGEVVTYDEGSPSEGHSAFIAAIDPAFILSLVAGIRSAIGSQVSDHAPVETTYGTCCRTCVRWQDDEGATEFGIALPVAWPCGVARAAASPFRDHPDYEQEWRPESLTVELPSE